MRTRLSPSLLQWLPSASDRDLLRGYAESADARPLDGQTIFLPTKDAHVRAVDLSEADRHRLWNNLLVSDAKAGYTAADAFAANPGEAIAFLRANLTPVAPPREADLAKLIQRLGADRFAERERASRELDEWGSVAVAAVHAERPRVASAEARERLDRFLTKHDDRGRTSGRRLREIRTIEMLEFVDGTDAIELLRRIGLGDSPLAGDARSALARMTRSR